MQPEKASECYAHVPAGKGKAGIHLKYRLTRPTLTAGTGVSQNAGLKDTRRGRGSQFLVAAKRANASVISTVKVIPAPPSGPCGSLSFIRPNVAKLPTRNSGC